MSLLILSLIIVAVIADVAQFFLSFFLYFLKSFKSTLLSLSRDFFVMWSFQYFSRALFVSLLLFFLFFVVVLRGQGKGSRGKID